MGKFDGRMIVTDLDGTLLRNDKSISEENLRAIRYFQAEGGLFAFVTGRIPQGAKAVVNTVQPNAPCGHGNGACIYDHRTETMLWSRSLPMDEAIAVTEDVEAAMPSIGIVLCTHTAFFQRRNGSTAKFCRNEQFEDTRKHIRDITAPLTKVMFTEEDEQTLLAVMAYLQAHPLADRFSFIRSDEEYYEMLPKGVSKGELIPRLSELTGVAVERIIAVGDNDNDASMLRAAGTGIAVANASEAARQAADALTVSNEEHALAEIIYALSEER